MRPRTRLLALALTGTALLPALSACASTDPDVERRDALNAVVEAANAKDADGMRDAVDELVALVNRQSGKDLDAAEVARIRADAARVKAAAGVIDTDEIERRRLQEELEEVRASQSAAAEASQSAAAEASASVAASISASAAAEAERQRQEQEASASATPSPTPSPAPTVDPVPGLDPGAVQQDD